MKRGLKKFWRTCAFIAGGIVLLIAAAVIVVNFDKPLVKKAAQNFVLKKTGVTLTIGRLDYRLFPLRIEASSVKMSYATPVFSVEIAAPRVGLAGDLKKLLKGEMPALDTAEAEIAEIRINQTKISPEPIDFQGLILQMANMLDYSRLTSLRCGRLVVLLLSQDFRLDTTSLTLTREAAAGAFDIVLNCGHIAGVMNQGKMSFGGPLEGRGKLNLGRTAGLDLHLASAEPRFAVADRAAAADNLTMGVQVTWQPDDRTAGLDLHLALAKPRMDATGKSAAVDNLTVGVQGTWQPDKMIFRFPKLTLDLPGLASFTGDLDLEWGQNRAIQASVKADLMDLEALDLAAGPFLPAVVGTVHLHGKAGLDAKYSLGPGPDDKVGNLSARLETQGIAWESGSSLPPLRGSLSGTLEADGPPADPQVSGDLRVESGRLSGLGAISQRTSAHIRFAGSRAAAKIEVPSATLNGVSIAFPGRKALSFGRIDLAGNAGVRLSGDPSADANLEARLPGLAPVRLAGRFGLRPRRLYYASLKSAGLDIAALRGLLTPYLPQELTTWAAGGTVDVSLEADAKGQTKGPVRLRADVGLSGGKFNDPDFTIASENLSSRLSLEGDYRPGSRQIDGTVTIELLHGESLWKRFYISWDKSPLKAEIEGRYDSTVKGLDGLSARVIVPGLGEFHAGGRLDLTKPLAFSLKTSSRFALEPALSIFSEAKTPPQGRLQVKGEASADVEIKKTGSGLTLKGRLTLGDVSISSSAAGFSIPSLSAELPLDLALPGASPPAVGEAPRETGTIRIGEVRASQLSLQVPPLSVGGLTNAYTIAPFAVEIFGGRLEFGKTTLAVNPEPLSLQGTSSARLSEIDLAGLPFVPAGSSLEGKVRADLPGLDITLGKITAAGRAEADVFGGQVVVTDLAVADPFAADREISCEVDLVDLDLKRITNLVPFGEVTGIIRGQVRDLVIAYGQPERFTLTLESVARKGVPRTFSLKAVNSLTVITAGQQAAPGSGSFWLRFIKGFRYDKIGIRSTLKNDTFTIDGTINENGVEYLVKRPLLFGISVINRNPGKTIGFKDMVSRLKRVGQSGAPQTKP